MNIDLDAFKAMLRIRRAEEELLALRQKGLVPGSIHLCCGQEAVPVGAVSVLDAEDFVTTTYRGHGWAIARGTPIVEFFAEIMGRDSTLSGGRGGSPYFSDRTRNLLGENSIVGAGVPIAAGAAFTAKLKGDRRVSVATIGDGALNQGAVHEALNLASVLDLPLVLVVENNGYSEMVRIEEMVRVRSLASRADGYAIPHLTVDGNETSDVAAAVGEAVARARNGGGPTVIEAMTQRIVGHHGGDVQHYRPQADLDAAVFEEPLARMRRRFADYPELSSRVDAIESAVEAEIEAAVNAALERPEPDPRTVKDNLYA